MFNKILVFWGMSLMAILIIENMVTNQTAYIFVDSSGSAWLLSAISAIIWVWIWIGLKWLFAQSGWTDDDEIDF